MKVLETRPETETWADTRKTVLGLYRQASRPMFPPVGPRILVSIPVRIIERIDGELS